MTYRVPSLFCLLVSLQQFIAQGQLLPPLPPDGSFAARGRMAFCPDPTGKLTLTDMLRSSALFTPTLANIPQFGKGQPPYWFLCRVTNPTPIAQPFVAEVDYPFLDTVQFFLVDAHGQPMVQTQPVGWASRLTDRPLNYRNPLVEFSLSAGQSAQLYVRAQARANRLSVPLRLWTGTAFRQHDRSNRMRWGWLNGVFASIIFIGGLLWLLLHERVYGYYALYASASWLYLISIEGFGLEWIDQADYGLVSAVDFRHLWNYSQALLGFIFLRWYVLAPIMHLSWVRLIYRAAVLAAGTNILLLVLNHLFPTVFEQQVNWLAPFVSLIYFVPIALFAGLLVWTSFRPLSRYTLLGQSARMYLLSTTPLLLLTGLSLLRNFNLIPDHVLLRAEGNALAILLEFIILSIGLCFRYKRLTSEMHQQRRREADAQLRLQQQEVRALAAQLRLQHEKERIARDLHDHVGSQLSIIATSTDYPGTDQAAKNAAIGMYAREAIQSLRDTIWAIHQEQVSLAEFRIKLQQYMGRRQELVEGCRLVLRGNAHLPQMLNSVQALNLFRIVQEALNNALKYAQASQITISCQLTDTHDLLLSIEDDGIGFLMSTVSDETHYGLLNMQRRATDLGGSCRIDAGKGRGTSIWVRVPLK